MNEYQHFNELREKYFKRTATPDEVLEFIALFESGKFEDIDQEAFQQAWDTDMPSSSRDEKIYNKIYSRIHPDVKTRSLKQSWPWMAAAAAILLFSVVGIWTYPKSEQASTSTELPVTYEGPHYVKLPDGSTITLNAGSTLSYVKESFGETHRDLQVSGTAFFDVAHDPRHPFKVQSGRIITTVLGTAFNVSQRDGIIEVTVVRGKVSVGDGAGAVFQTLLPNQKITVNTEGVTEFFTRNTNTKADLQWKEKYLVFDAISLNKAIAILEKRFEIPINFENPSLKNCLIEAEFFNDESLSQILESITAVHDAKPVIHGNSIMIEGGTGCD